MTNKDILNCKDFMAMPKNLAKWIKENYTYVVVAGDNPPPNGNWIQCLSDGDSYRLGRFFIDSNRKMWRYSTEEEDIAFYDDILKWVTEYHFNEDRRVGVGRVSAGIKYEDSSEKTREVFRDMSHEAEKHLACRLVEKVAMPSEDYVEDFDDPVSAFNFEFVFESGHVFFRATFRT